MQALEKGLQEKTEGAVVLKHSMACRGQSRAALGPHISSGTGFRRDGAQQGSEARGNAGYKVISRGFRLGGPEGGSSHTHFAHRPCCSSQAPFIRMRAADHNEGTKGKT